jgi:hypothetical protein
MADPNDPYASLTQEEANAARGQDIASRQFWNWLRGTMDAPPVVRRPSYQSLAGSAARSQDVNLAKRQGAQELYDEAQKRIAENKNRLNMSRSYATDPGSADYAPFVAGIPAGAPAQIVPQPERGYEGDSPRERELMTRAADVINRQREAADSGLLDRANFNDENAIPNPQRSAPAARMPLPVRRPAALDQQPAPQQSLLGRIFSGQDYQSSNALASDPRLAGYNAKVVQDGKVNWGDRDNAADFFRADKAMMAQREAAKKAEEGEGKAKGGSVNGKDAALHKALEIIHHLLTRGH